MSAYFGVKPTARTATSAQQSVTQIGNRAAASLLADPEQAQRETAGSRARMAAFDWVLCTRHAQVAREREL